MTSMKEPVSSAMSDQSSPAPPDLAPLHALVRRLSDRGQHYDLRLRALPPGEELVAHLTLADLTEALEELSVTAEELGAQSAMLADAEATIELERQRYYDLFELAPDTYLVTDLRGTIREANRAVSRLTGVPRRYVTGKPLASFVEQTDISRFLLRLRALADAAGDQVREWDVRLRGRTHGQPVIASARVAMIRDADGTVTALRWLLRDVTEARTAEARQRQEQQNWQQQLRERTSELEAVVRMRDASLREAQAALTAEQSAKRGIAGAAVARVQRGEPPQIVLVDLIKTLMES